MLLVESLLGSSSTAANYIEDVFSTWLYTGTGSQQTITNGINLSEKDGLVWIKNRGTSGHFLTTSSIIGSFLASNTTAAATDWGSRFSQFLTTGFRLGSDDSTTSTVNTVGSTFTSWTFRKQAKFFDVVTYTGTGANRTIAHNLGSVPGCIMVKCTSTASDWQVYHCSLANTEYMVLNSTAAKATGGTRWNATTPTSTVFSLGTSGNVNNNGDTYVAYLFAHNAGGFGATGADNVISCGSFTTDGAGNATVTLGYEPQWVLWKSTAAGSNWQILDTMRGWANAEASPDADKRLNPNSTAAESGDSQGYPTATGFYCYGQGASQTFIYIAIRRGPMKTPTTGTSVFSPIASSAATGTKLTTNFPVDLQIFSLRTGTTNKGQTVDRLRGVSTNATESGAQLITNSTAAETTGSIPTLFWDNTGFQMPSSYGSTSEIFWNFRRAPGFFDVVCYTGTGANTTQTHNLGVVPELMIVKRRSPARDWTVYSAATGNANALILNTTAASTAATTVWNSTTPTASFFNLGTSINVNSSSETYVAYLFATVAGVSKVGSYTGTGTTNQINCGFTGGARFVMIKRTDSTGDWYVWDTARGIVAGNDPYLLLNSTAAEVTSTDYIDTYSAGFEISSTAPAAINANGGTFIFLAIA